MAKGPIELLAEGSYNMSIIKMARLVDRKIAMLRQKQEKHDEAIYDMEVRLSLALDDYKKLVKRAKALETRVCSCKKTQKSDDIAISVPDVQDEVRSGLDKPKVPELQLPKSKGKKTKQAGKVTS